ncbi:MAG: NfeD family protein [Elainellaceae cyanobacterium]
MQSIQSQKLKTLSRRIRLTRVIPRAQKAATISQYSFIGEAIVEDTISPGREGRVHYQGSWWPARCFAELTLYPSTLVKVVGRQNITLLVEPVLSISGDRSM